MYNNSHPPKFIKAWSRTAVDTFNQATSAENTSDCPLRVEKSTLTVEIVLKTELLAAGADEFDLRSDRMDHGHSIQKLRNELENEYKADIHDDVGRMLARFAGNTEKKGSVGDIRYPHVSTVSREWQTPKERTSADSAEKKYEAASKILEWHLERQQSRDQGLL